jgi:hypothetical protein
MHVAINISFEMEETEKAGERVYGARFNAGLIDKRRFLLDEASQPPGIISWFFLKTV